MAYDSYQQPVMTSGEDATTRDCTEVQYYALPFFVGVSRATSIATPLHQSIPLSTSIHKNYNKSTKTKQRKKDSVAWSRAILRNSQTRVARLRAQG